MDEITIIIPVYNKRKYLDKCFESIFSQDFGSFEVIAVDDGSTDGSGDLCDHWAAKEPRLHVLHQENGGVTAARRHGYEHSQGRYIMFADADDAFPPGALSMMHRTITDSGADEVVGTYLDQYGNLHDSGLRGFVEPDRLIRDLLALRSHFCVLWGIIFRRELLDGCLSAPREIVEREDSLMQIKCLMKQPRVFFTAAPAYIHAEDIPNTRRETLDWIRIYDDDLRRTLRSTVGGDLQSPSLSPSSGGGDLPLGRRTLATNGTQESPYHSAFIHHQLKVYEKFIDRRQFHVLNDYYRPLRRQLTRDIPLMDRIAILLPPRIAYLLIHTYKRLLTSSCTHV